jgi:hypothetical protein
MNVRPGEIAYVKVPVGFDLLLADKVVTVIGQIHGFNDFHQRHEQCDAASWFVEFATPFAYRGHTVKRAFLWDSWLRPIRWAPGEDQTLAWAGKPASAHIEAR